MKKLILILTLIFALTLCFVACEEKDNNIQETDESTIAPSADEDSKTDSDAPVGVLEDKNNELIVALVDYLENYYTLYYMPPTSYEIKIDEIKRGVQPLHIQFDSKSNYFVCGYYNATHQYAETEDKSFCCVKEYIWVRYNNESNIEEYYDGKKCVVAFQINNSLFVKDILSNESNIPKVGHFQLFTTSFKDGKNINKEKDFDKTFIYLNSKEGKETIYYASSVSYHNWVSFPCVKFNGEYYITIPIYTYNPEGDKTDQYLDIQLGKYYEDLMNIMQIEEYSETNEAGFMSYCGFFEIEEFVDTLFK